MRQQCVPYTHVPVLQGVPRGGQDAGGSHEDKVAETLVVALQMLKTDKLTSRHRLISSHSHEKRSIINRYCPILPQPTTTKF